MKDKSPTQRRFASSPCYAAELCSDEGQPEFPITPEQVPRWRRAERERLRLLRSSVTSEERARAMEYIESALAELVDHHVPKTIGVYWPIDSEPDLRGWMRLQAQREIIIALPVVVESAQPLRYAGWRPGVRLCRGVWGIAIPADPEWVQPDMIIAPLLGVDAKGYRLGNGGGYFDRTLGAVDTPPIAVGVGFDCAYIETIFPQPHDIPMEAIVTG